MDRSRADEILREWSTVANSAHRPVSAPRRRLTRTALPAGLLAGAAIAVVVVVVAYGLQSRHNNVGSSGSPTPSETPTVQSSGSPTPAESPSIVPSSGCSIQASGDPSAGCALQPSESPTGNPTPSTPIVEPSRGTQVKVLSIVDCQPYDGQATPLDKGGTLYASCGQDGLQWPAIVAIDASSGKKLAVYDDNLEVVNGGQLAVDHGLWYSATTLGACVQAQCPNTPPVIYRMDLQTKKVTYHLDGSAVLADGLGYIWGSAKNGLVKIDPVTLKRTEIPWPAGAPYIAGGDLWSVKLSEGDTTTTTFSRVDPASGKVLATFTEEGWILEMHETADGVWAIAQVADASVPEGFREMRFVKIGKSGVESRSATFKVETTGGLYILNGTFWTTVQATPGQSALQRVDPATWRTTGTAWLIDQDYWYNLMASGNDVWVQTDRGLEKVDLPLQ